MERFCRTRLHYDADKNMGLLVKEMIDAMYHGAFVIFTGLDTTYDSLLFYMFQHGFTLLDSRFYTLFKYMTISAFTEAVHLTDSSLSADAFLDAAVGLAPKGAKDVLLIIDQGPFTGCPYNLATITNLAQAMATSTTGTDHHHRHRSGHGMDHGYHHDSSHAAGRRHGVRVDWPKKFSLVLSLDSHVMSSQELIYVLLNVPSLYIDNCLVPNSKGSTLRIPNNVNISSLSSILNPLLVLIFSRILGKEAHTQRADSAEEEMELEYRNLCYSELLCIYEKFSALQTQMEAMLVNIRQGKSPMVDVAPALLTRPKRPVSYAQFVTEHAEKKNSGARGTSNPVDHIKSDSQGDPTSSLLSVNTNLSWMLGTDYGKPSPSYVPQLTYVQTVPEPSPATEPLIVTDSVAPVPPTEVCEPTATTNQPDTEAPAAGGNSPEKIEGDPKSTHTPPHRPTKRRYATLTATSPSMGPYLEQILLRKEENKEEKKEESAAVVLPAVSKRLSKMSSLTWFKPPESEAQNSASSKAVAEGVANSSASEPNAPASTTKPSKQRTSAEDADTKQDTQVPSNPVKAPGGLRMLTKGKAVRLTGSGGGSISE